MGSVVGTASASRLVEARENLHVGQRELAQKTGISQATLNRIESGGRPVKMDDIILIAASLGCGIPELTGHSDTRGRVECGARAGDSSIMQGMRSELTHYLELDAYLEDQGIAQPV